MTQYLSGWIILIVLAALAAALFGCTDRPYPARLTFCGSGIICIPV